MAAISISIGDFLRFLRDSEQQINVARENLKEAERDLSDVEHYIEFGKADGRARVKLYNLLKDARIRRREAKEKIELLLPITEWCSRNEKVIRELQGLLGKSRATENAQSNRGYAIRGDILDDITDLTHLTSPGVG